MGKKILILLTAIVLSSCAGFEALPADYNFGQPPTDIESKIRSHFDYVLKDPDSARYQIGSPYKAYQNEGFAFGGEIAWKGYAVDVRINARNSYGGFTGWKPYLVYFSGGQVRQHCKKRENLDESIMDVCNDVLFSRF